MPTRRCAYPGRDTRETLELVYHQLKLASELNLLLFIGQLALQRPQGGHILDNKETELIAGAVEQFGLNFDLGGVSILL